MKIWVITIKLTEKPRRQKLIVTKALQEGAGIKVLSPCIDLEII